MLCVENTAEYCQECNESTKNNEKLLANYTRNSLVKIFAKKGLENSQIS